MNTDSTDTVVGVFDSPQQAQRAVMGLKSAGFTEEQIGVLSRNEEGQVVGQDKNPGMDAAEGAAAGAATGAATGAGLGALWGLGILAGVLPGIGPAMAGGTLGIVLSSAAAGAATASIAGALMGLGVSEDEAGFYETEFQSGKTLVTVRSAGNPAAAIREIQQHGGHTRQPQIAAP